MAKFKVGDVVQLKSGGPDMTVMAVYESGVQYMACSNKYGDSEAFYNCAWFLDNKHSEIVYPEDTLKTSNTPV